MSILSKNQKLIFSLLGREKTITDAFYLSRGTVLSEFYLHHRLSEDLDFFSENEFDPISINVIFQKIKSEAGIAEIRYEQSFNRNLYFLQLKDDEIKTEFTYYPFTRIEKGTTFEHIAIDSLLDIAVNKAFTIYQKPRSRDFIDLYCIIKKAGWTFGELVEKAQIKFDTYIDPIQLGSQLVKTTELKDYTHMIEQMSESDWQNFFIDEARRLESKVLE